WTYALRDGWGKVGRGRNLHAGRQADDVPELLQTAGATDRARELRRSQWLAHPDPRAGHHGAVVVPGRGFGVRLDRPVASHGDRVLRSRPDGRYQAGRRGIVVGGLVQR